MKTASMMLLVVVISSWAARSAEGSGVKPGKGAAALTGRIELAKGCADQEGQAWISLGNQLLYQADVMAEGSFEFHLVPGSYTLVVGTKEGCMAEREVTVRSGETQDVTLKLARLSRATASQGGQAR